MAAANAIASPILRCPSIIPTNTIEISVPKPLSSSFNPNLSSIPNISYPTSPPAPLNCKRLRLQPCNCASTIPAITRRFIDEDQLVVNLKKQDPDLKWPDISETWESLTAGSMQLLKGTSVYIVGDTTEINQKVAQELAVGLGYTPLSTKELLETFSKKSLDSWVLSEGFDVLAEAEAAVLESLSSHVRTVVATLGGQEGAARRTNKWRHLYAGFTVWLSQTEAADEDSAKEEAHRNVEDGKLAYTNADVVVKFQGWIADDSKAVAQASLRALKQLLLSDKKLPGKKSLYIRLGCRGDWPNIKPPGWDPSAEGHTDAPL